MNFRGAQLCRACAVGVEDMGEGEEDFNSKIFRELGIDLRETWAEEMLRERVAFHETSNIDPILNQVIKVQEALNVEIQKLDKTIPIQDRMKKAFGC
jgi:hypothetical protein